MQVSISLRVTDRYHGVATTPRVRQGSGDTTLGVTVPCGLASTSASIGSTCRLVTTADAVYGNPNAAPEGRRAIWEVGQVRVYDGGADGEAQTVSDNTLFAVQGLFVP